MEGEGSGHNGGVVIMEGEGRGHNGGMERGGEWS